MSEWRFTFEALPGKRFLNRYFLGIQAGWADPNQGNLWWNYTDRRWMCDSEIAWGKNNPNRTYGLSSDADCRSFRAFKRHVRRHSDKLKGHKVRLVSRIVGCDVFAEYV